MSRTQLAAFSWVTMRLMTWPSLPMTSVWRYASSGVQAETSLRTFGAGALAVDTNDTAPARAMTTFSFVRTGAVEFVFVALAGTPSAEIHASTPYFTHSSYGRTANPQLPHFSPQEFCTTKPVRLKPTSA